MELLWGDEPSPSVAVAKVTGLPPGVILHADNLEDVAPVEGHSCILARNSGVVFRIVVKKSSQKQLRKEKKVQTVFVFNRQTGDQLKTTLFHLFSLFS